MYILNYYVQKYMGGYLYLLIICLFFFNTIVIQKKEYAMEEWKKRLTNLGYHAEERFDRLKSELAERLGKSRSVQIIAYYGYGTPEHLEIMGRVLRDKGVVSADDNDTLWDNILKMYKRIESDELSGISVEASFQGMKIKTTSDEEGYFKLIIHPPVVGSSLRLEPPTDMWQDVELKITDNAYENVRASGMILVPPENASFGVISDIDDTIIRTGATNLLEMARNTFLKNARTRLPFPGVQMFYKSLQTGKGTRPVNPIFYVSNGPWNLFDFLADFMKLNNLPQGPILLRDFGIDSEKFIKDDTHKIAQISNILNTYPTLPFILIGDSGEKDPEIYQQIVKKFPGRILAVYIRDVTSEERDAQVRRIASEISSANKDGKLPMADMLLTEDTVKAAEHAAGLGLIAPEAVKKIKDSI